MIHTKDTQVLKLALEALESMAHGQDLYELEERAITAIKQALAAPVQEPVDIDPLPRACNLAGVDYQTYLKIKAYMPVIPPAAPYVASPRVPLTDEQIEDNFSKAPYETQHFANFEAGVRFAENYYGITEKGQP